IKRLQLAFLHQVRNIREYISRLGRKFGHTPSLRELGADHRIGDLLISGKDIGKRAVVASALHVVLSTHLADSDVLTSKISGQQRQAGKPLHDIDGLSIVGHAHTVENESTLRRRVGSHRLANLLLRNSGDLFRVIKRAADLHALSANYAAAGADRLRLLGLAGNG